MNDKETDKRQISSDDAPSPGLEFFREEAVEVLKLGKDPGAPETEHTFVVPDEAPSLPAGQTADPSESKAYWRSLRLFFRSGKGGETTTGDHGRLTAYPALLAAYRRPAFRPGPYPLWLAGANIAEGSNRPPFQPLSELLEGAVAEFAPQESAARILKDNLSRLQRIVRKQIGFAELVYEARPALEEALRALQAELNIPGSEGQTLEQDSKRLLGALPKAGVLVPDGVQAPLYLLAALLPTYRQAERATLRAEVGQLVNRLNDLLAVEKEKSPEAHSSEQLHDALDFADHFLNFDALSSVLPDSSSDAMPEERRRRIEKILENLQEADEWILSRKASLLIASTVDDANWAQGFSASSIRRASPKGLCRQAARWFDEQMTACARVFAAVRLARLELGGHYRPELHADFFAHFDWRSFSAEEWAACPPVFLIAEETALLPDELNDLSHLLASNRPIRIFVLKRTVHPEAGDSGETLSDSLMNRQELGALAIAHRNVCVVQTAAVDPVFLLEGLAEGLAAFSPVLFYVFAPDQETEDRFLSVSAAVEGRAFPSLLYNSERGPRWGARFDIGHNPQPDQDWPRQDLRIRDEAGKTADWRLPFTFADFAAQDPAFSAYFQVVPPVYWQDDLVPLAEYLEGSRAAQFDQVPFIWVVDEQHTLQKAAVAWPLVLACRDRLDHWRYLQENAGVHSYHVEMATEKLRRETEEKFAREKAEIRKAHEREIAKTAEEAARVAMERLAATLLDMDVDAGLVGAVATPAAKPDPTPPVEKAAAPVKTSPEKAEKTKPAPAAAKEEAVEETADLGEAWIDTPLCTSCNECIDLNKKIFQYDANKQAYVADPKGGPFADIVKAAENCPVGIIHPGAPQDPKEPGLKEWIERAKPFN